MALGDISFYDQATFGYPGDVEYAFDSSTTTVKAGEPVAKALGNSSGKFVTQAVTNSPVVATDFWAGIAATTSTNTSTASGTVKVTKMSVNQSMLIAPKVAASWDTQAEYDALVGARVLIDLTTGSFTILASDSATYGLVILPLNITQTPNKVRFAIRGGVNYLV